MLMRTQADARPAGHRRASPGIKTDHSLILYFILHGDNNAFYILLPAKG